MNFRTNLNSHYRKKCIHLVWIYFYMLPSICKRQHWLKRLKWSVRASQDAASQGHGRALLALQKPPAEGNACALWRASVLLTTFLSEVSVAVFSLVLLFFLLISGQIFDVKIHSNNLQLCALENCPFSALMWWLSQLLGLPVYWRKNNLVTNQPLRHVRKHKNACWEHANFTQTTQLRFKPFE